MKKHFKIIALILAVSLFAIGCGNSDEASSQDTLQAEVTTAAPAYIPEVTTPVIRPTEPSTPDYSDVDLSKVIAITFDDGPSTNTPSSTERILDTLEKYGVKATFFVQGVNLTYSEFKERNCALVKREAELGMEIGNHSYDHPNFDKMSASEIQKQLNDAADLIEEASGVRPQIVRTPYGAQKQSTLDAVDYPVILWNIDTLDWDTKNADKTYNEIMNNAKGGSIILMHDLYQATADAVEMAVPALLAKGYKLVTVSEMFEMYGQKLEPNHYYYKAEKQN